MRPLAYVLACYAGKRENVRLMSDNCLASVCSLLQTTAPADVIVFADPFIESALGRTFRHNRVQTLVVPEVNVSRVRRGPK